MQVKASVRQVPFGLAVAITDLYFQEEPGSPVDPWLWWYSLPQTECNKLMGPVGPVYRAPKSKDAVFNSDGEEVPGTPGKSDAGPSKSKSLFFCLSFSVVPTLT